MRDDGLLFGDEVASQNEDLTMSFYLGMDWKDRFAAVSYLGLVE